jgi:hypothetical protein
MHPSLRRYFNQAIHSADTPFAALAFVASMRDAYTGHYIHEGYSGMATAEEIHSVLLETHHSNFTSVLQLPLLDLSKQLRLFFQSLKQSEGKTAHWWLEVEPFRDLIPQGCSGVLRELFVSQVRSALEILCRAPELPELAVSALLSRHEPSGPLRQWLN